MAMADGRSLARAAPPSTPSLHTARWPPAGRREHAERIRLPWRPGDPEILSHRFLCCTVAGSDAENVPFPTTSHLAPNCRRQSRWRFVGSAAALCRTRPATGSTGRYTVGAILSRNPWCGISRTTPIIATGVGLPFVEVEERGSRRVRFAGQEGAGRTPGSRAQLWARVAVSCGAKIRGPPVGRAAENLKVPRPPPVGCLSTPVPAQSAPTPERAGC